MKNLLFILCYLFAASAYTQEVAQDSIVEDLKYREDQFYFSVTYNILNNKPDQIKQSGFSSGFHFGFIRDLPLNKGRNLAIGLGLGLSSNSFNQNILIDKANNAFSYTVLNKTETPYFKNKFTAYLVELPIEFRWRTSTPKTDKFWRIYAGFKVAYVLGSTSKFQSRDSKIKHYNLTDLNQLQYGLTLSAGYSTWNIHFQYNLNNVFSNKATLEAQPVEMQGLRLGLIFYIL